MIKYILALLITTSLYAGDGDVVQPEAMGSKPVEITSFSTANVTNVSVVAFTGAAAAYYQRLDKFSVRFKGGFQINASSTTFQFDIDLSGTGMPTTTFSDNAQAAGFGGRSINADEILLTVTPVNGDDKIRFFGRTSTTGTDLFIYVDVVYYLAEQL